MKSVAGLTLTLAGILGLTGCAGDMAGTTLENGKLAIREQAKTFLADYQARFDRCWCDWTSTEWQAAITGRKEDFAAHAKADLALKQLHSDPKNYGTILELLRRGDDLPPLARRALVVAKLAFQENQLPAPTLKKLAGLSAEISQIFNTFRGELAGKKQTNNHLLELLGKERDSAKRQAIWESLKQVGPAVGPKLVALAKVRNAGARKLGFKSYWEMKIRQQEHEPAALITIFAELEKLTNEPFRRMKARMDGELARRFGIEVKAMMPWHYNNPFFQAAPPAEKIDLDEFYRHFKKEDIAALSAKFYQDIGLPIDDILARSDLYEKEGKDQHAFCEDMDRNGDIRTLCNLRPTAEWMDTMNHEAGHAVYDKYLDMTLPFNLRQSAHALTTEGVAMLFGAQAKNPTWLVGYAGADPARIKEMREAVLEQRQREQLIFCRWTLVMFNFEKALYQNPEQDLNRLWWELKSRFQFLKRPAGRNQADWAAKPHFTIAPVYYHNYMLGELFAAQLRATLAKMAGHQGGSATLGFNGRRDFGDFLKEKVFHPGKSKPWFEFVQDATGEKLTARHFATELR